jgi:hypothetical protein
MRSFLYDVYIDKNIKRIYLIVITHKFENKNIKIKVKSNYIIYHVNFIYDI